MNPNTRNWLSAFVLLGLCCYHGRAQSASPEKPIHIPASGGEVVIATAADKARAYDEYHYAPARRAGDALYLSGVVVSRRDTDGKDVTAFKEEIRRAFRRIQATLAAAGANFEW